VTVINHRKTAVILFNLGGPDSPEAIEPFLFNLFNDPAILGMPSLFRWCLAKYISKKRAPIAKEIYKHLGGKSPLLEQTEAQARALEQALETEGDIRCFIAMRYWHPMTPAVVEEVKEFNPDNIVLLPLYPQFSTTTSRSSVEEWKQWAFNYALDKPTKIMCCYPEEPGFIAALAENTKRRISELGNEKPRLLFSAHGLPKKIIENGDPYQKHVERTCDALVEALDTPNLDWEICYQSRVGRQEWIGPSTDDEIERAGRDGKSVVLVPVAFVSEHSETLVELDIEYAEMAEKFGVKKYLRVPTVGTQEAFIGGLADMVRTCWQSPRKRACHKNGEACWKYHEKCGYHG